MAGKSPPASRFSVGRLSPALTAELSRSAFTSIRTWKRSSRAFLPSNSRMAVGTAKQNAALSGHRSLLR